MSFLAHFCVNVWCFRCDIWALPDGLGGTTRLSTVSPWVWPGRRCRSAGLGRPVAYCFCPSGRHFGQILIVFLTFRVALVSRWHTLVSFSDSFEVAIWVTSVCCGQSGSVMPGASGGSTHVHSCMHNGSWLFSCIDCAPTSRAATRCAWSTLSTRGSTLSTRRAWAGRRQNCRLQIHTFEPPV